MLKQFTEAWKMGFKGNVTRFILMSSAAPNHSWQRFHHLNGQSSRKYWEEQSSGNLPEGSSLCKSSPHMFPVALIKVSGYNGELLSRGMKKS